MLHQNKRIAKCDKFVKEQRADIPKIGSLAPETVAAIADIPIPENVTDTVITADEDEEFEFTDFSDWSTRAINEL